MLRNILVRTAGVAVLLLSVVVLSVLALAYFWPRPHLLIINNLTKDEVVITSIKLDDEVVFSGERLINPKITQEEMRSGKPGLVLDYDRLGDHRLTINGRFGWRNELKLTCELKDANDLGCIFYAGIKGANEVRCYCDPLEVFND